MKVFLAGTPPYFQYGYYDELIKKYRPYVLDSMAYLTDWSLSMKPYYGDYILDSGAFTFRERSKSKLNWEDFITQYAEVVIANDIRKFFELDIDNIVGYKQVLKFRDMLEEKTNRPCIPVWHTTRGKDDFVRTCQKYDYIALGGIVGKSSRDPEYKRYREFFPAFISIAHQNKCKIHGLGYTSQEGIRRCRFDSVDSTDWISGMKFGYIWTFNGSRMIKVQSGNGRRLKNAKKTGPFNYEEWCKFQKYAEKYL